jgi:hypothetical protein
MLISGSRQLRLAGLVCALALMGCGSSHKSGVGGGGTGYASFSWEVFDVAGNNYVKCSELGGGTVVVSLKDAATAAVVLASDPVSCDLGQMSTGYVANGSYIVQFDVYGAPAVYGNATTKLDSFDIADTSGASAVFHILSGLNDFRGNYAVVTMRSLRVGWGFLSGPASAALCANLGIGYVDLDFSTSAGATAVTSSYNCAAGQGMSYPYPYDPNVTSAQWRLYLVDTAGADITYYEGGSVALPAWTSAPADVPLGTVTFNY